MAASIFAVVTVELMIPVCRTFARGHRVDNVATRRGAGLVHGALAVLLATLTVEGV